MIQLLLLGNVDLLDASGASLDAPLRQSKRVALLAYLTAGRPTGFHRRDKIAALFWPELPTDRARAALRTTLTRLRDDHGAELILSRGTDEIAVDLAQLRCDVLDFDAAIAASRFEAAVALYRGPFLDGVHVEGAGEELEDWISAERSRLREGLLLALAALGISAEQRGDISAAIASARKALDASPNDEVLARRAISLLIASGNRGGAMQTYDEYVRRLEADLGVDPAPETDALVAPLRARGTTGNGAPANGAPTRTTRSAPSARAPSAPALSSSAPALAPTAEPSAPARPSHAFASMVAAIAVVGIVGIAGIAKLIAGRNKPSTPAGPTLEWRQVSPVNRPAPAAFGARAVLDSSGNAVLFLGGIADVEKKVIVPLGESYWRLRGLSSGEVAVWTQLATAGGAHPAPRWLFGVSSDAAHDRVVMHGGALGFTSPCTNDTWVLNHASGIRSTPAWSRVQARGPLPPARAGFDQVYDASRRRLIVFGGNDCTYPRSHETWVLAFDDSSLVKGHWSLLVPDTSAGVPIQRDAYSAAYDTAAARLFVFGGRAASVRTGELWALDHATGADGTPAWHPILCSGDHPVRTSPAGALDFASDQWTLFGGSDETGQFTRTVWRIHGLLRDVNHCRWERLDFAEPSPAARAGSSSALLSGSRGMLIFGGEFENTSLADAWVLKRAANR